MLEIMRVGIAHHFGWAVAVTAAANHQVVDRRRIDLIEPGMPTAPIHHEGRLLDDDEAAALVAKVQASAVRATIASLDELATAVSEPIVSMSLRGWPLHFPDDISVHRCAPYESRADSVMYLQVLAECARGRHWDRLGQRTIGWRSRRRSWPPNGLRRPIETTGVRGSGVQTWPVPNPV